MNSATTTNPGANEMNTKGQMIEKYNDKAREIATGFICNWVKENVELARSGYIPKQPTEDAWAMFNEECYPQYNTVSFLDCWKNDRAELLG
jgi:hypothetical protein